MSFSKIFFIFVYVIALIACSQNDVSSVSVQDDQKERAASQVKENLVETLDFQSQRISAPVKYHIYLPPSYASETTKKFPVIYWLHGSGGFPPGALQMLSGRFDKAMLSGRIPEAIVVFPDGFGQAMWLNSKDGSLPLEDIIIQEFIPHMDSTYRTLANREARLLEGGSMGGYGAARFGILYPDYFSAVSMINPGPMQETLDVENAPIVGRAGAQNVLDEVYGGDIDYFREQSPWRLIKIHAENVIQTDLKIRMILGEKDPITPVNLSFSDRLTSMGVEHELIVLPKAGHNPREMFMAMGEDYWNFFKDVAAE